jgi:hypothetical protein
MGAQIHRYGEKVAIYLGSGNTSYLLPRDAKRIAKHLIECAKDIEKKEFKESTIGTIEITINTEYKN